MLSLDKDSSKIIYEQVSIILGEHFVLTFQEGGRDVFDPVRERIRTSKGKVRTLGSDYLIYTLIDAVVDHYYVVLEKLGEHIESTEEQLVINPTNEIMKDIHDARGM